MVSHKLSQIYKQTISLIKIVQNFDNFFLCCKTFILGSEKTDFEYDILFLEMRRYIYLSRLKSILLSKEV